MNPALALWVRENLFPNRVSGAISVLTGIALLWLFWQVIDWGILRASWTGDDRTACLQENQGACWAFVGAKMEQFIYGRYPLAERWRVNVMFVLLGLGVVGLLGDFRFAWWHRFRALILAGSLTLLPALAIWLLLGGLGLEPVPTREWGGLMLTLVVATCGIIASLPLGVVLALARQSHLKIFRNLAIAFIEFIRGVPLITILFMASVMLPLFFPPRLVV